MKKSNLNDIITTKTSHNLADFGVDVKDERVVKSLPNSEDIIKISFRDEVSSIKSTTYLTHSIFYYPAKFIPHVVRYAIDKYSKEGDTIIDPYAGCGTVALEAYLCKRNSYLIDLSPMLDHIIPIKIVTSKQSLNQHILQQYLSEIESSDEFSFTPDWSNLDYWYDPEVLIFIKSKWGWVKHTEKNIYISIIEAELVKLSKQFSYAEHKMPKLFRSKSKKIYIEKLLLTDWRKYFYDLLRKNALSTLKDINDFIRVTKDIKQNVEIHGGIDTPNYTFPDGEQFDLLVTSPPYMQAQEYFRTLKMDLFWLGHTEKEVKQLSKLEIPYRKPDMIIETPTLNCLRGKIENKKLIELLDSYFCYTIRGLAVCMNQLKSGAKACIFIGNPTISGDIVEIWRIFAEYFTNHGFRFIEVYDDEIKDRQLFGRRNNKNPDGMKSEYLLILEKE